MKYINALLILVPVAAQLFFSCSPVLYSTVGQNVPMFTAKGEGSLNLGYAESYGEETTGTGVAIQAAYAISNCVAAIGSFYSMKEASEQGYYLGTAPSEWDSKGTYFEVGGGKYFTNPSKTLVYEVFAGIGSGSISNQSNSGGDEVKARMLKPFIQPSAGYISKYVDIVLTPRIGYLNYTSHSPDTPEFSDFISNHNNKVVFEPGITIRGGVKNVKLQFQYNYSTYKMETESVDFGTISMANKEFIQIGLYLLLTNRFKTNIKSEK